MNERIIVVPHTNKLLSSLAYKGKGFFNTRIFTPIELARELLLRSGKISERTFVSRSDELIYYKKIVETVDYFKTVKLADIKAINQTINTIRELVTNENEIKDILDKGNFKEKNKALYEVYINYIDKLESENKIDTIALIRSAISKPYKLDSEVISLKEYQYTLLDKELLKSAGEVKELSLFDLYESEIKDLKIESIKNCYGTSNEVASIIDDIFTNKNSDETVVALANYPLYSQIFYDFACKYKINISFGDGLALVNSYPGKLLKQYYYWISDANFSYEAFLKLIYSPYFNLKLLNDLVDVEDKNCFYDKLSKLRLTNDIKINRQRLNDYREVITKPIINEDGLDKYLNAIERIADELTLPVEEFIGKYAVLRNENDFVSMLDKKAMETIINEVRTIKDIGFDITSDIIDTLLRKQIYRQSNKPGNLLITSIEDAMSSLRKNLYVCGLSSSVYPGSPKENPLLLDSDLKDFSNEELNSIGKVITRKENLFNLINLANSLDNKINLSYAGLNVSELKNNNASSLLFEIYKRIKSNESKNLSDFKDSIINVEYFEPNLSNSRFVGDAYNKSKEIIYKVLKENTDKTSIDIRRYSPSALNTFFNCKKEFFYQNVLRLEVADDYDPYSVISPTEQGTLVHALMEYLADNRMAKDEFIKLASDVFDDYMKISVPLIQEKIDLVKEEFLEMLENAWNFDNENPRELAFKEEDTDIKHEESGLILHGFPDRVELTKDGKMVIIDFKTERDKNAHRYNNIDEEIETCLQVIVYAYIVENKFHKQIDHMEYRMLRYKKGIVNVEYNDEVKKKLSEKLIEFKNAVNSGDFSIEAFSEEEEKIKCKYCKYGSICGKVVTSD